MSSDTFGDYQRTFVTAKLVLDRNPLGFKLLPKAEASLKVPADFDSPDLTFVKFVFASEHENGNADYFPRSELLKAMATPRHKPFNIDHTVEEEASYISAPLFNNTKNTIIGHIVDSTIATKDGAVLSSEDIAKLNQDDDPSREHDESLDLIASAVLYKFCFPKTVADIEKMSEDGSMSVSMEAWFKSFDFLVGDKIVANSDRQSNPKDPSKWSQENRTLLEDWHKQKVVAGRRVSRVLRDVLFGGVAATEDPANKESVFITANRRKEIDRLIKRHHELHVLYNVEPSDAIEKEHEQITKAVASLREDMEEDDAKS